MTQKEGLLVLIKLIFIGGISVISSLASTSDYDIAREGARTPTGSPSSWSSRTSSSRWASPGGPMSWNMAA